MLPVEIIEVADADMEIPVRAETERGAYLSLHRA
jgi:hypothetical protein